jgi:glycosyltransferase involved in cell wall biosynthesis
MQKNKKPKIAVLATFFWPVSGDVQDYPTNIARILHEAKQDFFVLTPDVWPDGRKIAKREENYKGVKIKRFPVYASITWFTKLWFPKFEKDTNIIHCCGGYRHPHMFITFLRRKKAKFLLSPFFPVHPRKNPLLKFATWLIDATIGKYVISHAACCFAETKQEAEWLKKLGTKKIVMLPNPLPEEAFKKGNAGRFRKKYKIEGKLLFALGRHVPIKNFEEIISVLPDLIKDFPELRLVIGGESTKYTEKCKRLAKKLGVADKVIWPGFMNAEQKRDAYAACDIFVCSSIRESLGNVVLEAMAQSKPVICTNTGGLPEVVPDKFCLYKQGKRNELVDKIKRILKDKKFSLQLGKKGKKKSEKYRFQVVKERYLQTISELSR